MNLVSGARLRRSFWLADWRRRAALIGIAGVATLVVAYSIFWVVAAGALERRFRQTVAAHAGEHLAITHGEIRRAGFPGSVKLDIADPTYAYTWRRDDGSVATLTWHDTHMIVRASLLKPSVFRLDWPKQAVIEVRGADGTSREPIRLRAAAATVSVWLTDGRALPLKGELEHVSLVDGSDAKPTELLERFSFVGDYGNGADEPSARWQFEAVKLSGLDLRTGEIVLRDDTGRTRIDRLSGTIDVRGPLPDPSSNAAMAAWRDSKGRVDLHDGRLEAPKLAADLQGTLALDGEMRPASRIDSMVHGLSSAVKDGEIGIGAGSGDGESLLVVLLGLLSGQDDPNGPVKFSFETRGGKVYLGSALGSIRIGKVGPIDFEAANGPRVPFSFRFKG